MQFLAYNKEMPRVFWMLPLVCALAGFAADDDGNAHLLPDGPGKAIAAKACTECHSVDRMRSLRLGKDDWYDKVADMVDRGAKLTDSDTETLVAYLVENFGKDSKIRMNTAPMIEIKAVLGLKVAEVEAVMAYRESHGGFKDVSDLLKVPGIDPQKVEAKKDLMLF